MLMGWLLIIYTLKIMLARRNNGNGGIIGGLNYPNNGNVNANNYNSNPGNSSDLSSGMHLQMHNHAFAHSYSHTQAQVYQPNFLHMQPPPQVPMAQSNQTAAMMVNNGTKTKLTVYSSVSVQHQQQTMPNQQHPPIYQHPPRPQREQMPANNVINQGKPRFSFPESISSPCSCTL